MVLDLGSGAGSFPAGHYRDIAVVCVDQQMPAAGPGAAFVQADAARLPFPDASFDALIANHSLEHVAGFETAILEIGRVLRPDAALYIAVPDASTLTDRLYRWLFRGGGHVNAFRSSAEFARTIETATGLPLAAQRTLFSSFLFLVSRRVNPRVVALLSYAARSFDRRFGTRASMYGWAFYFGRILEDVETTPWSNVCVRCGTGRSAAALTASGRLRRHLLLPDTYRCASCGAWNLFTLDAEK